jgi:hypothetical protein
MSDVERCVAYLREKFASRGKDIAIGVRPGGQTMVVYIKAGDGWRHANIPRWYIPQVPIGY